MLQDLINYIWNMPDAEKGGYLLIVFLVLLPFGFTGMAKYWDRADKGCGGYY